MAISAAMVAALAAGGCGAPDDAGHGERLSPAEYQDAILDIRRDTSDPTRLYTDMVVERLPPERCSAMMDRFHAQVSRLVERAEALRPPLEVASVHQDLVDAASASVARVRAIQAQAGRGEIDCGRELNERLYGMPSSDRAARAMSELERRGYALGFK